MQELIDSLIGRSEVLGVAVVLAVIFIVLLTRWGFLFVKNPNGKNDKLDKIGEWVVKINQSNKKLLGILEVKDQDGTPLVYTPRSLEGAITKLADNVERLRIDISKKK